MMALLIDKIQIWHFIMNTLQNGEITKLSKRLRKRQAVSIYIVLTFFGIEKFRVLGSFNTRLWSIIIIVRL